MSRILLVEDDPVLGKGIQVNLQLEGYEVQWVQSLKAAFVANSKQDFHLCVLDLGLPDGSGLSFCTKLREDGSRLPIIILTAQTDEDSVVAGLQSGANDYMRKPFGGKELLARIRNTMKEPTVREDQVRFGNLLILREQRRALYNNVEIELNRREFDILAYLVDHSENVVSRENLMQALDGEGRIFDRTLDSHISHIRSKLRKAEITGIQITSIYGVGYRLENT